MKVKEENKMQSKKRAKPVKFGTSIKDKEKIQKEAARIEKAAAAASGVDPREEEKEELSVTEKAKQHDTEPESEKVVDPAKESVEEEESEDSKKEVEEPESHDIPKELPDLDESVDKSESAEDEVDLEESKEGEKEASEDAKETLVNKDVAFFNVPPDAYDKKNSMLPYFFRVMLVTLGLVFFAGIYYAVSHKNDLMSFINRATPTVTQAPVEVTPTEVPVDLKAYSIRVLNGTSTSGLAAKVRDELNASGFNVISVGNADEDNYEKTEIEAVEKVQSAFLDKLKAELASSYEVGEVKSLSTGSADIIVTVGSASAR
jgi:hypothetical protein